MSRDATEVTTWKASAPGRVNLIGEHVDYNQGWVLPMAIGQRVSLEARPMEGSWAVFESEGAAETVRLDLSHPERQDTPDWGQYVQGVLWEFIRATGCAVPGFHANIQSDISQGAGLSSSAALEVSVATLLEKITGHALAPLEKAQLCQQVEHTYAGVPCGLMDQAASTLCEADHVLLLDCVTHEFRQVPFQDPDVVVLIANSGVSHQLADGAYARRRQECEEALAILEKTTYREVSMADLGHAHDRLGPDRYRRARHVLSENGRTLAMVHALEESEWARVGELLYAGHASIRDDFEVSCTELDFLVETAQQLGPERGVIGARMSGGGFGGSTVTLVERHAIDRVQSALENAYRDRFGFSPTCFVARPSQGAC